MIRRTVTASALFLAMSASGSRALVADDRPLAIEGDRHAQAQGQQTAIRIPAEWSQRWESGRCRIATPERGDHLGLWFRPGNDAKAGDPRLLLDGFITWFVPSGSSPTRVAGIAAERVIGHGAPLAGKAQVGVAVLAPTPTGTLILASRGVDADLPGRLRDLLILSTLV
jgi:hypothetical protein